MIYVMFKTQVRVIRHTLITGLEFFGYQLGQFSPYTARDLKYENNLARFL